MNAESLVIIIGGAAIGGLGVWFFLHSRRGNKHKTAETHWEGISDTVSADALILGELENPLVEITSLSLPEGGADPLKLDTGLATALQPLLQRAPQILKTDKEAATKSFRIVFSPAVTRGLNDGSMEVVETRCGLLAVARDASSGRFVERGKAVVEGGVRVGNAIMIGFQIAAVATAQNYLPEINERLRCLEDRVADIHFFQHEEKRGELRAAIHLLRQYHDAIARGKLHAGETAAIFKKLEDLEQRCLAIGELAHELLRQKLEELETLDIREELDRSGSAKRAAEWVQQNRELLELIFFAQSCRVLGCQVKAALPGDRTLLRDRIEHARCGVHNAVAAFKGVENRFEMKAILPLGPRKPERPLDPWDFLSHPITLLRFLWKHRGIFDTDYQPQVTNEFAKTKAAADGMVRQFDMQTAKAREVAQQLDSLASSGLAVDVRLDKEGTLQILSAGPV